MYLCAVQAAYKELGYKVQKSTFAYTNSTGLSFHKANSKAVVLCQLLSVFFHEHEFSV